MRKVGPGVVKPSDVGGGVVPIVELAIAEAAVLPRVHSNVTIDGRTTLSDNDHKSQPQDDVY